VPGEETRQTAGADRNPVRLKSLAQLAQEDLRASLIGLPDELGMSLDVTGALARLTPKRSAACRQVAPAETADATRWRKSTDKVVAMAASLPHQPPAAQRSFRSDELRSRPAQTTRAERVRAAQPSQFTV
jgi:hypothetical protein